MNDFMLDIETLGTRPGSVVVSVALVAFNREDTWLWSRYWNLNLREQVDVGLSIDPATMVWWMRQSSAALARWASYQEQSLSSSLRELHRDLTEHLSRRPGTTIWAKDPSFDVVILNAAFAAAGLPPFISHRAEASVRTLKLLCPDLPEVQPAIEHDPVSDAEAQASFVCQCWKVLSGPASREGVPVDQAGPSATAGSTKVAF